MKALTKCAIGLVVFAVLCVWIMKPSGVAAAAEDWDGIVAKAKAEGEIVIYGPPGQSRRKALVDAFQRDYPEIKVNYVAGAGREQGPRLLAERKAGKYTVDLHIGGTTTPLQTLRPQGVLDPISPHLILPEVKDPSAWFKNQLWFADTAAKHNVLFEGGVSHIIAINTDLVANEEITSYHDLLTPKWKGKIVAADIRRPGPGGGQSRFLWAHPELGPDYLKRLFGDTDVTLSLDRRQMVDWLAQGKHAIHVFPSSIDIERAIDQGLPVKIIPAEQLKEGAPLSSGWGTVVVINRAPHPNATKVYLNWLLSRKGQLAWQKHAGAASLRKDISKEDVRPWNLPREDKEYFFVSGEEYMSIETKQVRDLVTQAVEGGKAQ